MNKIGCPKKIITEYEVTGHQDLPHVVRFSGGRSSGAMMMLMLQQGLLNSERGDVILFSNTSAEHPATYDFVRTCSLKAEKDYGIPFFWIEFASYEDAYNGEWIRRANYRLVNNKPLSKSNKYGYRYRGEVFEELISMKGFLPSRHSRICTTHLKLETTQKFLSEWFTGKEITQRLGHHYSNSHLTDESIISRHEKSNGKLSHAELLSKKNFVRNCKPYIKSQKFSDFSIAYSNYASNKVFVNPIYPEFAPMIGKNAIKYVSLIGLRADEPRRVARVLSQNRTNSISTSEEKNNLSVGEIVYTPLADSNIDKADVLSFWDNCNWDLAFPPESNLSNCVFCFMKGTCAIKNIQNWIKSTNKDLKEEFRSLPNTPSDIKWWVDIEERYQRKPLKRSGEGEKQTEDRVTIGFWGVDSDVSYSDLAGQHNNANNQIPINSINTLPCDCTD